MINSSKRPKRGHHLREWAKDKKPLFAYIAITGVAAIEDFQKMLKHLYETNIAIHLPPKELQKWLKIAKKSRKLFLSFLKHRLPKTKGTFLKNLNLSDFLISLNLLNLVDNKKQLIQIQKELEKKCEQKLTNSLSFLSKKIQKNLNCLIDILTSPQNRGQKEEIKPITEELFFYNNHLLCLIQYNECFTFLYRRARLGDYDAIAKLIRIDPIMLKDPHINNHYLKADLLTLSFLKKALKNPLKYHTKIEKLKVSFCGFISAYTAALNPSGHCITPAELRKLFDAYAIDVNSIPCDEDLPDETDAFRKAVKRHHKIWQPFLCQILQS